MKSKNQVLQHLHRVSLHLFVCTISLFLITACNTNTRTKTEREGEPDIYNTELNDREMNQAMADAKASFPVFEKAIQAYNENYSGFALKVPFAFDGGTEHIWVGEIVYVENLYIGIVNNVPEYTREVSLGDTIPVDPTGISDWMYLDGDTLRGGYTIRVIRNGLPEVEKKDFDSETGFIIPE